jgi:hypothetical protein
LKAAAEVLFTGAEVVRHVAINRADAAILRRHLGGRTAWLPNLMPRSRLPRPKQVQATRSWLTRQLGEDAPVWLAPSRLLRRKNIAEALLLTRWLRPEAWFVTTGGPSSPEEQPYHAQLQSAARQGNWRVRLGVLADGGAGHPSVPELLAASEVVLMTSLQEGFGLPYLEAAVAGRPFVGRWLPNVAPDLNRLGFEFPQSYRDVAVPLELFDTEAERRRQAGLFRDWKEALPAPCRPWAETPSLLDGSVKVRSVAFSRLTLRAQLEVLAQTPAASWEACAPLNPFLRDWRERARAGLLAPTHWSRQSERWLSGAAYAERLLRLRRPWGRVPLGALAAVEAQRDFMRARLARENLYPLLWSPQA